MRTFVILIFSLALFVTGCGPSRPRPTSKATTTNWLVTQFGEHRSQDGVWRVSVPSAGCPVELARGGHLDRVPSSLSDGSVATWTGTLTNTYMPGGWKAQPGWFVFVEDASRAWCYDGSNYLWLLRMDSDGSSGSYGPECFPCPVPQQVRARLTDSAQRAITRDQH